MRLHFFGRRRARHSGQMQTRLFKGLRAFAQVARRAGGNHIFPRGDTPARPGQHVIKREVPLGSAILATKLIAQKKIKAREGHALLRFHIVFQHHDRGYSQLGPLASHHLVVFGDDGDAVQESGFYRLLPWPERQRVIRQRAVIGVQDKGGVMPQYCGFTHEYRSEITLKSQRPHLSLSSFHQPRAAGQTDPNTQTISGVLRRATPRICVRFNKAVAGMRDAGMTETLPPQGRLQTDLETLRGSVSRFVDHKAGRRLSKGSGAANGYLEIGARLIGLVRKARLPSAVRRGPI